MPLLFFSERKGWWKQRVEDEGGVNCLSNSTAHKDLSRADWSQTPHSFQSGMYYTPSLMVWDDSA